VPQNSRGAINGDTNDVQRLDMKFGGLNVGMRRLEIQIRNCEEAMSANLSQLNKVGQGGMYKVKWRQLNV